MEIKTITIKKSEKNGAYIKSFTKDWLLALGYTNEELKLPGNIITLKVTLDGNAIKIEKTAPLTQATPAPTTTPITNDAL